MRDTNPNEGEPSGDSGVINNGPAPKAAPKRNLRVLVVGVVVVVLVCLIRGCG